MPEAIDPRTTPADPAFDAFLDVLDEALDLPAGERAEVREEIGAHLRQARAEAIAAGTDEEAAVADVLRGFGDPRSVGRDLSRARQRRSALLAAAGAGTLAAAGAAFRGYILGIALIATVLSAIGVLLAISFRAGLTGTWSLSDQGWYTAVLGLALWFAAWHGGRSLVTVLAQRTHRRAEHVRPFVALVAGLGIAWLSLAWLHAPQNLVSVVVLAAVPVIFAIAALTGSDRAISRSKSARRASLALFASVLVAVPTLVMLAGTPAYQALSSSGPIPYDSMEELLAAQGFDMPGRFVPDPPAFDDPGWTIDRGVAGVELGNAAVVTGRWDDLRVEAWRADLNSGSLDRASGAPFATAPLIPAPGDTLIGSVRVDRTRDVNGWWLVLTGSASDGVRDLVLSLGGTNTTFSGSALDWLAAP